MYLANVKNIPIGIVGSKTMILSDTAFTRETAAAAAGDTTFANWNFSTAFATHQTYTQSTTLTVALPIFSGLIGV